MLVLPCIAPSFCISNISIFVVADSSSGHSGLNDNCRVMEANGFTQMSDKLSLPVFGLASYKLKGSIWTNKSLYEQQLASSLLQAAENRLQLLKVDHPDFRFFLSHYNTN